MAALLTRPGPMPSVRPTSYRRSGFRYCSYPITSCSSFYCDGWVLFAPQRRRVRVSVQLWSSQARGMRSQTSAHDLAKEYSANTVKLTMAYAGMILRAAAYRVSTSTCAPASWTQRPRTGRNVTASCMRPSRRSNGSSAEHADLKEGEGGPRAALSLDDDTTCRRPPMPAADA